MYPLARTTGLIVETLPSETVVYDTAKHKVHCLNKTASLIWQCCDGNTGVDQIADRLNQALRAPLDADAVRVGLLDLRKRGLLVPESFEAPYISRREAVTRATTLAGAFVALLPAIRSITAPTPAMAASADNSGGNGKGNGNGNGKGNGNGNGNGKGNGKGLAKGKP